jgi:hypothetical protein
LVLHLGTTPWGTSWLLYLKRFSFRNEK